MILYASLWNISKWATHILQHNYFDLWSQSKRYASPIAIPCKSSFFHFIFMLKQKNTSSFKNKQHHVNYVIQVWKCMHTTISVLELLLMNRGHSQMEVHVPAAWQVTNCRQVMDVINRNHPSSKDHRTWYTDGTSTDSTWASSVFLSRLLFARSGMVSNPQGLDS